MPACTKGLVPVCLVLVAMFAWIGMQSNPGHEPGNGGSAPVPEGSPDTAALPPGEPILVRTERPVRSRPAPSIPLEPGFLDSILSPDGNSVTIPLPGGGEAAGGVTRLERDATGISLVQGETTRPRGGRFFFHRQSAPGKAGPLVGYLHTADGETAWRVVPDPADPERRALWEKTHVDQVVCRSFSRPPDQDPEAIPPTHPTDYPIPPEENGIIQLESLPGAAAVVYLDFDGENRDFASWGRIDAAAPAVTNAEIFQVWKGVSEDFQPFALNITTIRAVFDAAPPGYRMQVVITPTTTAAPGAGGVAYLNSFNWTADVVCWSFYATGKNAVEVISHEIGHTLGLSHDGRNSPWEAYYAGGNGWAPIMGVAYSQPLSQWSKGEYPGANNPQDDTYIIANHNNGLGWREDDHGATFGTASWLDIDEGGEVAGEGFIGTPEDKDSFRFTTAGGPVTLDVRNVEFNPNLNVMAEIVDSSGAVVAASDPPSSYDAAFTDLALSAGEYLLRVSGVGQGNPSVSGFSAYGSLGAYTVSGVIGGGKHAERLVIAENSPSGAFVGFVPPREDHGSAAVSFAILSGNSGGTFAINPHTGAVTVADPSLLDFETLSPRWDVPAAFELFVDIADNLGTTSETIRVVVSVSDENEAPTLDPIPHLTLLERQAPGTFVRRVTASDPDRGSRLSYAIMAGNTGGAFAIDPATGALTVHGDLDFETAPEFSLVIRVSDDGPAPLHDEAAVGISLVDIDETLRPGTIERLFYENITGNAVASLMSAPRFPSQPDAAETLTSFDSGTDRGDNYGSSIRGFLVPAVSGDYTFWLASDDWGELWISPDDNPANRVKLAEVVGWTQPRQWDKYLSQRTVELPLVAGRRYFIEALHKEGGGEDHVSVAWQGPGAPSREVVPGNVLVPSVESHAPWMDPLTVTVRESAGAGQSIAYLPFVEADCGQEIAAIEIIRGNDDGYFAIDPVTRHLVVGASASLNAGDIHELTVRATDDGAPPMSGTAVVTVRVIGLEEELHAWWRFDESSGSLARDSSGNERHATIEGGVGRVARDAGDGALQFDGSSGRVEYLGENALAGATPFTLAAWVRIPPDHAAEGMVIQQQEAGSSGHVGRYQVKILADGRVNFLIYGRRAGGDDEGYQFDITSSVPLHPDAWCHIACGRDGDGGFIYIDGVLAASGSGAVRLLDPALTVAIGCDLREDHSYLGGRVDDVRIYQDSLGAPQVRRLAGTPRVSLVGPASGSVGVAPGVGLWLEAAASDPDGGEPTASWSQIAGPAAAELGETEGGRTTARFREPGAYSFRFTASDGQYSASRDVTVIAGTTAVTPFASANRGDSIGWHSSPEPGAYLLEGSSTGIAEGSAADAYLDAGQCFSGDFDVSARVDFVIDLFDTDDERAGLVVRAGDGTDVAAPGAYIGINGGGYAHRVIRAADGAPNETAHLGPMAPPCWVRIARVGDQVSLYRSEDGAGWEFEGSVTMGGMVRAGLCWGSGTEYELGAAAFSQVSGFCDANVAPAVRVDAIPAVGIGAVAQASGSVTDDGMPEIPGSVSLLWTAPESDACEFDAPAAAVTNVSATSDGSRLVRLIADDGDVRSFADTSFVVLPTVTVSAPGPVASESGPAAGVFSITRDGAMEGDLEVAFEFAGSAEEGVDYTAGPPAPVVIPAGASSVEISILPIPDALVEGTETVELALSEGAYLVGGGSVVISITDSNHAPAWIDPLGQLPGATADASYAGAVSPHAADPDGDALEFHKISGPDWLHVAPDGSLEGTPGAGDVGSHSLTIRVSDPAGASDDMICFIMVYPAPLVFGNWQQIEFGAFAEEDGIAGDLADPDHDNRPNILEYTLGTDPNVPDPCGIAIDLVTIDGAGRLRIRIPLDPAAVDVVPVVEGSGDPSDPASWSPDGLVIEESSPDLLVVRDDVGGPRRFLRLRVSRR